MTEHYMPLQEKEIRPQQIGWLGPVGTFTEKAAKRLLSKMPEGKTVLAPNHSPNIASIFKDVIEGKLDIGVVPIENTIGGPVKDTHKALEETKGIRIIGEVVLPIQQYFYYQDLQQVTTIASKDQALAQVETWIKINYPSAKKVEVNSTSFAVLMAAENSTIGAIAGEDAAIELGIADKLKRTEESIEDNKANATTFVAIAKTTETSQPTRNDKTTLIMELPHRAGSLYSVLTDLAEKGINLTKIKSLRHVDGRVRFLISIDGHEKEERISSALTSLLQKEVKIKMLGSYPRDDYSPEYRVETDTKNAIQMIKKEAQNGDTNNKDNNYIVVFTLPHEVGALAKVLKVFAERKIDLTKIDSLPSGNFEEYIFYLAYDKNNVEDQHELIKQLTSQCAQLILLTS